MFSRLRARRTTDEPTGAPHCSMCGTPTTVDADGRCPLGHHVGQPQPEQPQATADTADGHIDDPAGQTTMSDLDELPDPVAEVPPAPVAVPEPAPVADTVPEPEPEPEPGAPAVAEPTVTEDQAATDEPAPVAQHDVGDDEAAALHTSSFFDDWGAPEPEDATLPDSVLDLPVPDAVASAAEDEADPDPESAAESAAGTDATTASQPAEETADGGEDVAEARERLLQAASWFSAGDE